MILIIASSQDPAGVNIADNMLEHHDFEKVGEGLYEYVNGDAMLTMISQRTIFRNYIERDYEGVNANFFITRHSSESGIHTLTTHTPGNFSKAMHGGIEGMLCPSNPCAQKIALRSLKRQRDELGMDYEVSLEATHHGPATGVPTTFFEVGSSLEQWKDAKAGEVVANATIEALGYENVSYPMAVGVGGGHYPQKLSEAVLSTDWAIGHVVPKYAFPLDNDLISKIFNNNSGGDTAIFDWKGTPNRTYYSEMFNKMGFKTLKTKDLTESMP